MIAKAPRRNLRGFFYDIITVKTLLPAYKKPSYPCMPGSYL
jgi:hypothetical protein